MGKYFLPLLELISTEALGRAWLAALRRRGHAPEDSDRECATLADYGAPPGAPS